MEQEDKSRREYYAYYSGRTWGGYDPHHLMIDSSLLGIDGTTELIISVAKLRIKERKKYAACVRRIFFALWFRCSDQIPLR